MCIPWWSAEKPICRSGWIQGGKKMLRKKKQINMLTGNLRGYRRIKNDFFPFYLSIILYFFILNIIRGKFFFIQYEMTTGFLSGSAGKESACNVGDAGSIPGSKRSPGEENGNPLQYSLLLLLLFINWRLITLQYCSGFCHTLTWISHGYTCIPHPDPPSHPTLVFLPGKSIDRGAWWATIHRVTKCWTQLSD